MHKRMTGTAHLQKLACVYTNTHAHPCRDHTCNSENAQRLLGGTVVGKEAHPRIITVETEGTFGYVPIFTGSEERGKKTVYKGFTLPMIVQVNSF